MPSLIRASVARGLGRCEPSQPLTTVGPLLRGIAAVLLANGLLAAAVPLRMNAAGTDLGLVGFVGTSFPMGLLCGYLGASPWVARLGGERFALVGFTAGAMAATLALRWSDDPLFWVFARGATGFFVAGVYLVVEAGIAAGVPPIRRTQVFARYMLVCQLALGFGQLWAGAVELSWPEAVCLAALFYAVAAGSLARARIPRSVGSGREGLRLLGIVRAAPVAVVGAMVVGASISGVLNLGPLMLRSAWVDAAMIPWFMVSFIFGGLALLGTLARLPPAVDRRRVLAVLAGVGGGAALMLMAAVGGLLRTEGLLLAGLALGASSFAMYPACLAVAHASVAAEHVAQATRVVLLACGVGSLAGPLVMSPLLAFEGVPWLFVLVVQWAFLGWAVCSCADRSSARLPTRRRGWVGALGWR